MFHPHHVRQRSDIKGHLSILLGRSNTWSICCFKITCLWLKYEVAHGLFCVTTNAGCGRFGLMCFAYMERFQGWLFSCTGKSARLCDWRFASNEHLFFEQLYHNVGYCLSCWLENLRPKECISPGAVLTQFGPWWVTRIPNQNLLQRLTISTAGFDT